MANNHWWRQNKKGKNGKKRSKWLRMAQLTQNFPKTGQKWSQNESKWQMVGKNSKWSRHARKICVNKQNMWREILKSWKASKYVVNMCKISNMCPFWPKKKLKKNMLNMRNMRKNCAPHTALHDHFSHPHSFLPVCSSKSNSCAIFDNRRWPLSIFKKRIIGHPGNKRDLYSITWTANPKVMPLPVCPARIMETPQGSKNPPITFPPAKFKDPSFWPLSCKFISEVPTTIDGSMDNSSSKQFV